MKKKESKFDIFKSPIPSEPEPEPKINLDVKVKDVKELLPDVLRGLKIYLDRIESEDFIRTANQKDSASLVNSLIDLLKFILSRKKPGDSDDSNYEKQLEAFKKILGEK